MLKGCLRLLQIGLLLLLLGFVGMVALVTLVDPNQYKAVLQKQAQLFSQRTLHFEGPLRWRISHGLSIEANNIHLSNAPGFENEFLNIKKAHITPHFWSLITGRILIDVYIDHADLHLVRNAITVNNWQDLLQNVTRGKNAIATRIILNAVQIKNLNISFKDNVLKRHYSFKKAHLDTGSLIQALKGNFCLAKLDFYISDTTQEKMTYDTFINESQEHLNNAHTLHASFSAEWKLSDALKTLEFKKVIAKAVVQGESPIHLAFEKTKIRHLNTKPIIEGSLTLKSTELTPILNFFKVKTFLHSVKFFDFNADFKYAAPNLEITAFHGTLKPLGYFEGHLKIDSLMNLRSMQIVGSLQGKGLKLSEVDIPELKASIQMKNSVLSFNPIEYQYAGGEHRGQFQIDYSTSNTRYRFSQESNHFEISSLLEALGYHNKIHGRSRVKFNLSSEGESLSDIKQNVKGQGEFEIINGKIIGIDAGKLLKHAQSTIKSLLYSVHQKKTPNLDAIIKSELGQWEEQANQTLSYATPFIHLMGNFTLGDSVITNPDLSIIHPQFIIHGNGTLNLSDENMIYQLYGTYKEPGVDPHDEVALFLNQTPLGLEIKGPIQEPGFNPNLENYAQHALKFSQHNMFERFVDKTFNQMSDTLTEE